MGSTIRVGECLLFVLLIALASSARARDGEKASNARLAGPSLSFTVHGYLGGTDGVRAGVHRNSTITFRLSNRRTFRFDGFSADPTSPGHWAGWSGSASIVLSDPVDLLLGEGEGTGPVGPTLFRGSINDFENGMMYEFIPDVNAGEMAVVGRRHQDLPNSGHMPGRRRQLSLRGGKPDVATNMAEGEPSNSSRGSGANRHSNRPVGGPGPQTPKGDFLDVMVVWTQWAECANATPMNHTVTFPCLLNMSTEAAMRSTVDLAIAMSNEVLKNSDISTRLRLVHSYRNEEEVNVEGTDGGMQLFERVIENMTEPDDGFMDGVHAKRHQYGATFVSLILHDDTHSMCGMAWQGEGKPVEAEELFNVIDLQCAITRYDLIHEIAHNLGARHDRGTQDDCDQHLDDIQYGYRHKEYPYRTVMAYDCKDKNECDRSSFRLGGCSILPILSGPESRYMVGDPWKEGRPVLVTLGNTENNNSDYIRNAIREVQINSWSEV